MTYLLTVEGIQTTPQGLHLSPGIRLRQTNDRPAIAGMRQGAALELRRPDGSTSQTVLASYGVSVWRGDDGARFLHDDPADPEIKLTLPAGVPPEQVPPGTEIWLRSE